MFCFKVFSFGYFFCGLGACAVSRLLFFCFFGLGLSTSYSLVALEHTALCGFLASRFPWLLGFSASRLLGLSTSYSLRMFLLFSWPVFV